MLILSDSFARYWAILSVAFLASGARAETTAAQPDDVCKTLGDSAVIMLTARDNGVPLSKIMAATKTDSPEMTKVAEAMAIAAYGLPSFNSPEFQEKQRRDFRNQIEVMCYQKVK